MLHDRPDLLLAWVKYREGFIHALHFLNKGAPVLLHSLQRGGVTTCEVWPRATFEENFLGYFQRDFESLNRIGEVPAYIEAELHKLKDCVQCIKRARAWGKSVADRVDALPPFHYFL
ncbi:hypothetical protein C8R43DRAFT_1031636 [Mycena crocata]|nr:hypothetical protein C8R43DRAFT_1031636 [Mycena crocata]